MGIKLEDKDFKYISSSLYAIMTINMNVKNPEKGAKAPTAAERRELVISAIKDFPASVIFCQEVPSKLEEEVEKNFGPGVYEFAFTEFEAAVMWRKSVFKGDRQFLEGNDPSSIKITERLKQTKSDVDVSEVHTRTAMVKLTSVETGASFLAVSWHGASKPAEITRLKALNGLICFLYEVCKDKLSSCIIGGDFNLDTSTVVLTKHKDLEVTISLYELSARDKNRLAQPPKRGRRFIPYKDTFIISVTLPSYKHPMTGDITVPLVRPLEPENETGDHNLMDHVPVGGVLKLACVPCKKPYTEQDRDTEDTSKSRTLDETANEKYTPEKKMRAVEVVSGDSDVRRKLFEDDHASHSDHESILDGHLKDVGLSRIPVDGDGNCFFTAVAFQLHQLMSTTALVSNSLSSIGITTNMTIPQLASLLRELVVKEWLSDHIDNYIKFVSDSVDFVAEVAKFEQPGYHHGPLGDLMPMAMANVLHMSLAIVTSEAHPTLFPVDPSGSPITNLPLFLAYNSFGAGHYDGTVPVTKNVSSGVHMIRSMEDPTRAETSEASDVPREEETYRIMTINMKCTGCKGEVAAAKGKDLIISTIKRSSASVIFCQEAPGDFKNGIVAKCGKGPSSYKFVPEDIHSSKKVAVMWRETDFDWKEVDLTKPSITKIKERLKHKKSVADVEKMVKVSMERSAMVKLTSRGTTEASFLAVSSYWPEDPKDVDVAAASKAFYDLICFVREVCEDEKLFWFIIGGDLIFHTSKVHLTEVEGVTISCGPSIVPIKDIFVFSVPSVNKLPKTVDITLSEEKPLKLKNESKENPKLKHVPVVRVLNLAQEKALTSCSSESSISIPNGYVTRKDFEELITLMKTSFNSTHAKVDPLTADIAEIKLAIKRLDGSHGSDSQAQPTEADSQTTEVSKSPVLEQGSDIESTSEKKEEEKKVNK